jgi:hypothetical protein
MIDMRQLSILVVVTIRLFVCYAATSTGKLLINVTICSAIDIALSELFAGFAPIPLHPPFHSIYDANKLFMLQSPLRLRRRCSPFCDGVFCAFPFSLCLKG